MPRGRQSRILSHEHILRLEEFRRAPHEGAPGGYSLPQLRRAMAAPFSWKTLKKALQGLPIWELSHGYIVQWMERYSVSPGVELQAVARDREAQLRHMREAAFEMFVAGASAKEMMKDLAPSGKGLSRATLYRWLQEFKNGKG